jgi:uncharacterized membrane protein (DUF2068 family)
MSERRGRLIVLIGIGKLAKAVVLVAAAISVLLSLQGGVHAWLEQLAAGSGRETVIRTAAQLVNTSPHTLELIASGLVLYATLFAIEGMGLIRRKVWAEWLTIIITCSFIPLEIYEVVDRDSAVKAAVLCLNVLIAAYLMRDRWRAAHQAG